MNLNQRFNCNTCHSFIDCRIGMSNRDIQPIRFACPTCGEGIFIEFAEGKETKIKGAKPVEFKGPFVNEYPFVDLHLDFPVEFGEYKMGQTPYLKAVGRIGHKNYDFHFCRLESLNSMHDKVDELQRALRLFSKNPNLFGKLCERDFGEKLRSENPVDVNLALYCVLAKVFFPFSMPNDNSESVELHMSGIGAASRSNQDAFDNFIKEIIESGFLKNVQRDCLEIYPQILSSELALRPALFLDFVEDNENELVAFRVSTDDFQKYKDLYKDISEIISRQLILVAGINNIIKRQDHNNFKDVGEKTPKSINAFADLPYGFKLNHLDDCWYTIGDGAVNNHLRNSIAHVKIKYDDITQQITYYPKREGIKQKKAETMYFSDFMRRVLISYREMHRLNHLIKCLLNYYYLIYMKKG